MPDTMRSSLYALPCLIMPMAITVHVSVYGRETEDQRGEVTCLRLHSWQGAEQGLNPGHLTLESPLIVITKLFILPLVCLIWLISLSLVFLVSPSLPIFDHQDDAAEQSQFLKNLGQKQQIIGVAGDLC